MVFINFNLKSEIITNFILYLLTIIFFLWFFFQTYSILNFYIIYWIVSEMKTVYNQMTNKIGVFESKFEQIAYFYVILSHLLATGI